MHKGFHVLLFCLYVLKVSPVELSKAKPSSTITQNPIPTRSDNIAKLSKPITTTIRPISTLKPSGKQITTTIKPIHTTTTTHKTTKPPLESEAPCMEDFQMEMGLCTSNISLVCVSVPGKMCSKSYNPIQTSQSVNRQTGQCTLESKDSNRHQALRFVIEVRRTRDPAMMVVENRKFEGKLQRGKCVLEYFCYKRYIQTISMDCGSLFLNETGTMLDLMRHRGIWVAPPKYGYFVNFSAKVAVDRQNRILNVSSINIGIPDHLEATIPLDILKQQKWVPDTNNSSISH